MAQGVEKATGQAIILKSWRRYPDIFDDELREIWRQEIRQLHRLSGFPGARNYIVGLLDSGEQADGFYLALSAGQRLPLATLRTRLPSNHFLLQPRPEKNRLLIWQNMRRISVGLEILHTQGLLHRNLDEWAIFTDSGSAPDFQLSGFEWSIRLAATANKSNVNADGDARSTVVHSFVQDWNAFGKIAASLLAVDLATFSATTRRESGRDSALHLIGAERELLHLLLRPDSSDRIDAELVNQKIDAIISGLESIVGRRDSQLLFTCLLGPGTPLSGAIREASSRTIDIDDIEAQLAFIVEDLVEEPLLLVFKPTSDLPIPRRVLAGTRLTYRIQPFQAGSARDSSVGSWAIAYCAEIGKERPAPTAIAEQIDLSARGVQVLSLHEARRKFAVLQGRAPLWDRVGISSISENYDSSGQKKQHRALLLVQVLEALFTAAEIWPVSIRSQDSEEGRIRLRLTIRADYERERLSKALMIAAPAVRMRDTFSADAASADEDWVLTDVGALGERETYPARWRLVDVKEAAGEETVYEFDGTGVAALGDWLFLRKADHAGEDKLLRRRIRALKALKDHVELLEMLDDPRLGIRRTHEVPAEDERFLALDQSKQEALRAIWASTPLFLLQGPPGVGKTRLVRELVGRRIREDGGSRMLLTAQSHHAVDHLLEEVSKELTGLNPQPLVVRSRSKDRNHVSDRFDVRHQAANIISHFKSSVAVAEAPEGLRLKVDSLVEAFAHQSDEESPPQKSKADRSIEALLLRSAQLVFASTNAADLERLVEERSQFDWTVIEEAGKATGTELISPLLLSHRRLMIGDHKQLPPFNADRLKALLANPTRIAEALDVGASLVGRPFREAGMDELIDEPTEDMTEVCGEAAAALMMFETLVEGELTRASRSRTQTSSKIAQRLNRQHRMHPAIAKLVSAAFYDNDLHTDEDAIKTFASSSAPFRSLDIRRLPNSPIVVVDMPYVQNTTNAKSFEKRPRFHNPTEVDALIEVLSLLKASGGSKRPSLAVLAPYREQVKRLKHRIGDLSEGRLSHLKDFSFEGDAESPTGTVDSFQGSEADAVVMSLVRNNHHTGLRGMGFLADARRMNVLLSRARWKLVLIVSLDFLRSRMVAPIHNASTVDFLPKMLNTLSELQNERGPDGTPLATIVSYKKLMEKST